MKGHYSELILSLCKIFVEQCVRFRFAGKAFVQSSNPSLFINPNDFLYLLFSFKTKTKTAFQR